MELFAKELRRSARSLVKSPVFTSVAMLTLALGIGANAAIFSFFKSTALHPLPFPRAERLVNVHGTFVKDGEVELRNASYPEFRDWAEQTKAVESMAGFSEEGFDLLANGNAERVEVGMVTPGYFRVYGIAPGLGRTFREDENTAPKGAPVAVLSHQLWRQRFGGDPGILGKGLSLSGVTFQVIGVMPERFRGSWGDLDLWIPVREAAGLMPNRAPKVFEDRTARWLDVVARLAPGATVEALQSEMNAVSSRLAQAYPDSSKDRGVRAIPLEEDLLGKVQGTFRLLFGAVALVLLIACVNVTNLLLARTTNRRKEIAIRASIGAPRSQLVMVVACETLLLGLLGGIVGLGVGKVGIAFLKRFSPLELPTYVQVGIDPMVFGFAMALSLLIGFLLGLLPAAQVVKTDLTRTLKDARGGADEGFGGVRRLRSQNLLVAAQVAIGVPILIGAGLVLQSFRQQQAIDPGFKSEGLLTFRVHLPPGMYPERQSILTAQRLQERVAAMPGVDGVSLASDLPLGGGYHARLVAIEDHAASAQESEVRVYDHQVGPEFFAVTGIPLLQGSRFTPRLPGAARSDEVIVSKAFSEQAWPGQNPLGKRIAIGDDQFQVIGVAGDVHYRTLLPDPEGNPDNPDIYRPILQAPLANLGVLVKSKVDPARLIRQLRQATREVDPSLPVFEMTTMEEVVAEKTALGRFSSLLFAIFGSLALFLIGIGIYGVTSYSVSQRSREIGIRMAIGARPGQVLLQILKEALWVALIGLGLGVFVAYGATRLLNNLLFGISSTDTITFLAGGAVVLTMAILACYPPARRASRLNPLVTLKSE